MGKYASLRQVQQKARHNRILRRKAEIDKLAIGFAVLRDYVKVEKHMKEMKALDYFPGGEAEGREGSYFGYVPAAINDLNYGDYATWSNVDDHYNRAFKHALKQKTLADQFDDLRIDCMFVSSELFDCTIPKTI